MLKLSEIIAQAATNTTRYRRIEYIVNTTKFRDLFSISTDDEKQHLLLILESGSEKNLKQWMDTLRRRDYSRMTARELRKLASLRKVEDYNILQKDEIINELQRLDQLAASTLASRIDDVSSSSSGNSRIKLASGDESASSVFGSFMVVPGSDIIEGNGMEGD